MARSSGPDATVRSTDDDRLDQPRPARPAAAAVAATDRRRPGDAGPRDRRPPASRLTARQATASPASAIRPRSTNRRLRYFARQGDTRRLDAEIARLKAIYPEWQPPARPFRARGLFRPRTRPHVAALLRRAAMRMSARRSPTAPRQGARMGAAAGALVQLLDQADTRIRLTNASDAKQWNAVVSIAAKAPSLLTCDYVDVLWRVAEAFAKTDRPNRAEDAYTYILTNCDEPEERLATVQKAVDLLPEADVDKLFASSAATNSSPPATTRIRQRVGKIAETETGIADPADLARLETSPRSRHRSRRSRASRLVLLSPRRARHRAGLVRQGARPRPGKRQGGRGLHAGADRPRPLRRGGNLRLRLERKLGRQSRRLSRSRSSACSPPTRR